MILTPFDEAQLTDEQRHTLTKGRAAFEFVNSDAWKMALDWLEEQSNIALSKLRKSASSDPRVVWELNRNWSQREDALQKFQEHFLALAADYEAAVQTVSPDQGKIETEGENLTV